MSISSINVIMRRIDVATIKSPIAVFTIPEERIKLNAVFGATKVTKDAVIKNNDTFVGMYNRTMDTTLIRKELRKALLT